MPVVRIAGSLKRVMEQPSDFLQVTGQTVQECLSDLVTKNPAMAVYVYQADKTFTPFINIYLNGNDIRFIAESELRVTETDEIEIMLSLSGG